MMPPVGKSGPGHEGEELLGGRLRVGDQVERRVAEFGGVVRRDRGRHADRDALRAVGEQVREGGRQHDRLLVLAVVGVAEIDRVLVDAVEQQARDLGQPRLGVAMAAALSPSILPKLPWPVDERVALREILREAHERVVDRLVAVRVVLADDVADDARAFLERRGRDRAAAGAWRAGCAGARASARRAHPAAPDA